MMYAILFILIWTVQNKNSMWDRANIPRITHISGLANTTKNHDAVTAVIFHEKECKIQECRDREEAIIRFIEVFKK